MTGEVSRGIGGTSLTKSVWLITAPKMNSSLPAATFRPTLRNLCVGLLTFRLR